jgi:YD repeat-containing protein
MPPIGAITSIDQVGVGSATTYDPVGNAVSRTDGAGQQWRLEYDPMNRLTAEISPLGDRQTTHYDANRNVTGRTKPDSTQTRLVLDSRNDLIAVIDNVGDGGPATAEVNVTTRYERSAAGWVTAMVDSNGHRSSYQVDSLGHVVRSVDPLGRVTTGQYNSLGLEKGYY